MMGSAVVSQIPRAQENTNTWEGASVLMHLGDRYAVIHSISDVAICSRQLVWTYSSLFNLLPPLTRCLQISLIELDNCPN